MKRSHLIFIGLVVGVLLLIGGMLIAEVEHVRSTLTNGKPDFATYAIPGIAICMIVIPLGFMFLLRGARRRTPGVSSKSTDSSNSNSPGLLLPALIILGLSLGVYWLVTNIKGENGIAYILFLLLLLLLGGWLAVNRRPPPP